jgi:hypothetical protein
LPKAPFEAFRDALGLEACWQANPAAFVGRLHNCIEWYSSSCLFPHRGFQGV